MHPLATCLSSSSYVLDCLRAAGVPMNEAFTAQPKDRQVTLCFPCSVMEPGSEVHGGTLRAPEASREVVNSSWHLKAV